MAIDDFKGLVGLNRQSAIGNRQFPSLYAILDVDVCRARGLTPLAVLDAWLIAGIRLIQLRAKSSPSDQFLELASDAAARCHAAGATFIVNDRADIARISGADGVHVGQTDLLPVDARKIVSDRAIVGMSTHSAAQVTDAIAQPIDYLAIGPVYPTSTTDAGNPVVGLEGVRRASEIASRAGLAVVAIGGITLEHAPAVLAAGASSVAVISDLLKGEPTGRAVEFLARTRRTRRT